jgi:hypothetical protein
VIEPARVTRRTTLAAVLAMAAAPIAACGRSPFEGRSATESGLAPAARRAAGDRGRALRALQQERAALGSYGSIAASHHRLADGIAALEGLQRRHIDELAAALGEAAGDGSGVSPSIGQDRDARTAVVQVAEQLRGLRLRDCVRAESSAFASLMASMAASHSMVAATWGSRP